MTEIFPKKFIVEYIFFIPSASNKIELIDKKLIFTNKYGNSELDISKKELILDEKDWIQFWSKLDGINAWNWDKEYKYDSNEILEDGNISNIKIDLNDKKLDSFCWCKAPDGLEEFFKSLKALTRFDICDPKPFE
jgi:hypothetical protein